MRYSIGFFVSLLTAAPVFAHGWVVSPASRQQSCAARQTSFDCGDIKYEPQSVEGYKGQQSCSGGSRFGILDQQMDWPLTRVGSQTQISWKLTAPHRTMNWEYYLDGRLFAVFDEGNQAPPFNVVHSLSGLPSGRHQMLAVWNIGDTPMAFYSCLDLLVD